MQWQSRLEILRWRSLEEADARGELLSGDKRRAATAETKGGLKSERDAALHVKEIDAFLERRAKELGKHESCTEAMKSMTIPLPGTSWSLAGWIVAFVCGFGLTGIGSEREINLLALPLVGVLVWNFVVISLSLLIEFFSSGKKEDTGWLARWWSHRTARPVPQVPTVADAARVKFVQRSQPLLLERLRTRSREWFHIAAALLAIGSGVGMYAKGWSHEYRAVWESTLLGPEQARGFFEALFSPASKAFALPVPLDDIAAMQRKGGVVERAADALPWIHLYSGTLGLLVVLPRLLLAGLTMQRGARRETKLWREMGWSAYALRLLRAVEGGGESVAMLLHGISGDEAQRDAWSEIIQEKAGGKVSIDFQAIPFGDEDEFTADWKPASHIVALVFQLATTPEDEVQGRLAADLRDKLRATFSDGRLIVLLDEAGARERWTDEHVSSRRDLWRRVLGGKYDSIESVSANHLRVSASQTGWSTP